MSDILLNYELVARQLASADVELSGAEVHGMLCGLLCSGREDAHVCWSGELLSGQDDGDLLLTECRNTLDQMYRETSAAINGPGLGFTVFLPDDETPVQQRGEAVSDWCQGFLFGVGLSGIDPEAQLSAATREALGDFSEISRLDVAAFGENDEEDDALIEITEFLWVAATLVHSDLVNGPTERS